MTTAVFASTYPKQIELRDGTQITLRPMESVDERALLEFFRLLPEEDRFYLKDDVTSQEVIRHWSRNINYFRILPLLAITDGRIVADATLHHKRPGSRKHAGEIRISVGAEFRGRGLGTKMVTELVEVAHNRGLELVVMELVEGVESEAINLAERLGFTKSAVLTGHVKDPQGDPHNLAIMELLLDKWYNEWFEY
ncbi:MAG: putative GCN5-related N-acetyltransferase [Dehalococcoidia bacterium]|nr:putative GCN5-related N-acetyltransferase [Dehalococcoidia bacterium]